MVLRILLLTSFLLSVSCNSSTVDDVIEIIEGVPRKTIDTSRLGVNAFANDGRFGSISSQYSEVRDTLGLRFVRVVFGWDDNVQPTPGAAPNFSFYDNIVSGVPGGVDILVVLRGVPSWMSNPANWINGNPRLTFVERWVRPCISRYGSRNKIIGFQIWNEPNMSSDGDNSTLDMLSNPDNYVEMLAAAYGVVQELAPSKLVVNAATTAITQNYPRSLNYNKDMKNAGAEQFVDIWAIHYYGKQYEKFIDGVKGFLKGLDRSIWITETGKQGVNAQLAYGEEVWPYLRDNVSSIDRIYVYQFTESTAPGNTFGLKNLSGDMPVSDLYIHLRDRN